MIRWLNLLTNFDEMCYDIGMSERTNNRNRPTACCTVSEPCCLTVETLGDYAKLLTALADPTRLGIINMLANNAAPVCVCDITAQFNKGQPTISHHLGILREAGLVHGTREGIWAYYTLNRERLNGLQELLANVYQRGAPLPLLATRLS